MMIGSRNVHRPQQANAKRAPNMMRGRRVPLGIASDDTYLQSLIGFVSTPETAHLSRFAKPASSSGKRPSSSFASENTLPVSISEMTVDRLQQAGNDAFKQQDLKRAV